MLKRMLFALPCLTAVGLLTGCATSHGPTSLGQGAEVIQTASNSAPRKLPAVPPLPAGPQSPLLQLGLIMPTPRPQLSVTVAKNHAAEAAPTETLADARPATLSDDARLNRSEAVTIVAQAAPAGPGILVGDDLTFEAAASAQWTAAPQPSTRVASADSPKQSAAKAARKRSGKDTARVSLPQIALAPAPESVDLPVEVTIQAKVHVSSRDVASVELPPPASEPAQTSDETVSDVAFGVDLPQQVLAALPAFEPRRRTVQSIALAKPPKSEPVSAEGGPDLPLKLRR